MTFITSTFKNISWHTKLLKSSLHMFLLFKITILHFYSENQFALSIHIIEFCALCSNPNYVKRTAFRRTKVIREKGVNFILYGDKGYKDYSMFGYFT